MEDGRSRIEKIEDRKLKNFAGERGSELGNFHLPSSIFHPPSSIFACSSSLQQLSSCLRIQIPI